MTIDAELSPPSRGSRSSGRVCAFAGAAVLAAVVGGSIASVWRFTTDDAFIALRYSRHLFEGQGLVWNVGEAPVEGYSSFLFVALGALALSVSMDPVPAYKIVSAVALVGTAICVYRVGRLWLQPLASLLPVAVLAAQPGTVWWTVSGLETSVFQLAFVASHALLLYGLGYAAVPVGGAAERPTGGLRPALLALSGACVFAGSLMRPEGPLIGISMGLIIGGAALGRFSRAAQGDDKGQIVRRATWILVFIGLLPGLAYSAYTLWRFSYFGEWLPNTVVCKAPGAHSHPDPLLLVRNYWTVAALPMVLVLLRPVPSGSSLRRRFDVRDAVLVMPSVLYTLALWGADPIIGHMNRHFLSALALLLVPAAVSAVRLADRFLAAVPGTRREGLLFAAALLLVFNTVIDPSLRDRVEPYVERTAARVAAAHWLAEAVGPRAEVVAGDVGVFGYVSDFRIRDAYCLNSALMTSDEVGRDPQIYAQRVLDRQPEAFALLSTSPRRFRARAPVWDRFLEDPRFDEEYHHQATFPAGGSFNSFMYLRVDLAQPDPSPGPVPSIRTGSPPDSAAAGLERGRALSENHVPGALPEGRED